MHLDHEAAKLVTLFNGLADSGWHSLAIANEPRDPGSPVRPASADRRGRRWPALDHPGTAQ